MKECEKNAKTRKNIYLRKERRFIKNRINGMRRYEYVLGKTYEDAE
jgi:hypothetical protein